MNDKETIVFAENLARMFFRKPQYEMTGYEMIRMYYDEISPIGKGIRRKWILSTIKKTQDMEPYKQCK